MADNKKLSTIIDNFPENTMLDALRQLLPQTAVWDIATGTFEIGSLLALDGLWQPLKKIQILAGDETTRRTRQELIESIREQTDDSIEATKEREDALTLLGLDAIRHAFNSKQIHTKIYTRNKFHAKAYRLETERQPVDYALIGSSNFTEPGLTRNIELNLFTTDCNQIAALKAWFQRMWNDAEDVNAEILKVIERHLRAYTPFEIWFKALYEHFAGREIVITDWERHDSVIYNKLSQYQQDGYRQARAIANKRGGVLICDGVGLGKTFIALMLLEYHIRQGDRILLIAPKSARESVWESALKRYLRPHYRVACEENLKIHNHTDFGREGTISDERLAYYRDYYSIILVDEAHHFRSPGAKRSKILRELCDAGIDKRLYFLTATPINNSLRDLYHLINYIARDRQNYFSSLGIHHLSRYFTQAEEQLESRLQGENVNADVQAAAQDADLLRTDILLKELVIQRSRAYVTESEKSNATVPIFPNREAPQVIPYSLKKVYAGLYDDLKAVFDRDNSLLTLAIYNPEPFRKTTRDERLLNRDKQIIGLIRTMLLKRLESSYKAFEASTEDLLYKMAAFIHRFDEERFDEWRSRHLEQWKTIEEHQQERQADKELDADTEEGNEFDDIDLPTLVGKPEEYRIVDLLSAIETDMTTLSSLLAKVYDLLSPDKDDKLKQLKNYLLTDPLLKDSKVIIFTEFRDTARYLWKQLRNGHGFSDVEELDSTRKVNREVVIKRFAPHYNCTIDELPNYINKQIRILISTDVLSEGLNLQDANLIVNYDLHWNPVRLMQRIGRVDRRLNLEAEKQLGRDNSQPLKVHVFNFLPPKELDELLHLFRRVTGKLLHISKTLGIEAPILTPEDDFEAIHLLNERYEGHQSFEEKLHSELDRLRCEHPILYDELSRFPRRVFSGKRMASSGTRGLFCCYRFPPMKQGELGEVRWYFRAAETGEIWESNRLEDIANTVRSAPETQRTAAASAQQLKEWRRAIERERVQAYLRDLQAPMDMKATLVCWMEVC